MKLVEILPPITLKTTSGEPLLDAKQQEIRFKHLDFLRVLASEPAFLEGKKGRAAAAFQALAVEELESEPDEEPEPGECRLLSDDVVAALARAAEGFQLSVNYGGKQVGHAVLWCFLPFLDSLAKAKTVAEPKSATPTAIATAAE